MIMITFIYSAVLGGIAGILVAPMLFVSIQMGSTIALKAFAATIIGGFGDVAGAIIGGLRSASSRPSARLYLGAVQGRLRLPGAVRVSLRSDRKAFSANGSRRRLEIAPLPCIGPARLRARRGRRWWRSPHHQDRRLCANILMQAATYAIAVFGLSVVLGLCGQINLAQAAFFALGAYGVALGNVDLR